MFRGPLKNKYYAIAYHQIRAIKGSPCQIGINEFYQQLDYFKNNNYKSLVSSDLKSIQHNAKNCQKNIILTFDDGEIDHYEIAYKALKERNLKGIFFIPTSLIGKENRVTEEVIKEMSSHGMEIGSHSNHHIFLDKLSENEIYDELHDSKEILQRISRESVISLSPPFDHFSKSIKEIASNVGYEFIFLTNFWSNSLFPNRNVINRIDSSFIRNFNGFYDFPFLRVKTWHNIKSIIKEVFAYSTQK
jgi:peptidoglycan/xylan/chitin deacetylase (PgdA/CDA1 family)